MFEGCLMGGRDFLYNSIIALVAPLQVTPHLSIIPHGLCYSQLSSDFSVLVKISPTPQLVLQFTFQVSPFIISSC